MQLKRERERKGGRREGGKKLKQTSSVKAVGNEDRSKVLHKLCP